MTKITLPHNWSPRPYQETFWRAMMGGAKRASLFWHRRGGKDDVCMNLIACQSHMRVGEYWHMCPYKTQVRKAIWESRNRDGVRRIDQAFPVEIRKRTLEQEMMIEFQNGSLYRCLGSDAYDQLVGSNPFGLVFSEWALCDPKSWDFLRPVLSENGGWAAFITTPRGYNHAYDLHELARGSEDWFHQTLTIDDTGAITREQYLKEIADGMSEQSARQEFYCEVLADSEYQLINSRAINDSMKREVPPTDAGVPTVIGIDVGLTGDESKAKVRVGRDARTVPAIHLRGTFSRQADQIVHIVNEYKPDAVFVDSTGIGYGLVEMVKERGIACTPVNFANSASSDSYENIRAEMYDRVRKWIEQEAGCIEDSPELRRQLAAIRTDPASKRIKIEGKAEIKARLGRSPDDADALALTFARHVGRRDSVHRNASRRRLHGRFAIM